MAKRMLIDATHSEETRVAVIDGNRLIEFDYESKVRKQLKGSIFLAKVTRVEPSLQAAFVNFGGNRHGFLPFAEIHPDYFRIPIADREALIAEQKAMLERLALEEEALIAEEEAALAAEEQARNQQASMADTPFVAGHDHPELDSIVNEAGGSVETVEQDFSAPTILNADQDSESQSDDDEDDSEDDDLEDEGDDDSEDAQDESATSDSDDHDGALESGQGEPEEGSEESNEAPQIHAWVYRAVTFYDESTGKFEATDDGVIQNFTPEIAAKLKALCEAYADIVRIRVDAQTVVQDDGTEVETAIVWLAYKSDNEAMLAQEDEGRGRYGRGRYGRRFRGRGRYGRGRNDNDNNFDGQIQESDASGQSDTSQVAEQGDEIDGNSQNENREGKARDGARGRGRFHKGRDGKGRGRDQQGRSGGRQSFRSRKVEMLGGDTADGDQPFRFNLRKNYKIQEVIKRGQIMLIQVQKEERGNKGAAVTSYLSLPGRFSVLMPNSPRGGGVSRKIASFVERKRMREILKELSVPDGMSVILRTAGVAREKDEIKRDLDYLMRLWDNIRGLTLESSAPALVYEESSLVKRAVRDIYSSDIDEMWVAGDAAYTESKNFMSMLMPDHAERIARYEDDKIPLFHRYQVENQIAEIGEPVVQLRSGGYLVINPTEALVSIDVNSGRATKERHIEETAVKTNLEAAEEVARQLRLRDLGGLVVIDFIDMEDYRNNAKVERRLREALSTDRARIQVGRISSFGLLELSRQRLNPSLTEAQYEKCPHCHGAGFIRSVDSASILALRALEEEGIRGRATQVFLNVPNTIALYILNNKRDRLMDIERRYGFQVYVRSDDSLAPTGFNLEPIKGEVLERDDDGYDDAGSSESYAEAEIQESAPAQNQNRRSQNREQGREQGQSQGRGRGRHQNQKAAQVVSDEAEPSKAPVESEAKPVKAASASNSGFKAKRFSSRKAANSEPAQTAASPVIVQAVSNETSSQHEPEGVMNKMESTGTDGPKKKGWWNKLID